MFTKVYFIKLYSIFCFLKRLAGRNGIWVFAFLLGLSVCEIKDFFAPFAHAPVATAAWNGLRSVRQTSTVCRHELRTPNALVLLIGRVASQFALLGCAPHTAFAFKFEFMLNLAHTLSINSLHIKIFKI